MTSSVKLPAGADELLHAFPADEPDFEAQASAIEARLRDKPAASIGDELLGPPELAAEPGEPAAASRVRAAAAPKSNFAEMARKSLNQKDDDGARELLVATAQSRRPSAEMVERVRAAGRQAAASATPLPLASAEAQRPSGVVARAEKAAPTRAEQTAPTTSRGTIIGVAGAALALAACFALFMKSESSESAATAALVREMAARESAAPIAAKPSTADAPAAKSDAVMTPEALAAAPALEGATAKRAPPLKSGGGAVGPSAVAATKAPAPGAQAQAQQPPTAVVLEEDAQPQAEAKAKPEPAPEPVLRPAEGSADGVPLTPSAGAVSTALSSVRGSAQACLAGQNDPVSAVVTFASDGHVLRVSAAGPSGACIQAALSKARLQPFARASFSATTTIRPP
ncbi:MAG TPA: hypothetical protein VIW29_20725 [Polyangiaceae bacterium]